MHPLRVVQCSVQTNWNEEGKRDKKLKSGHPQQAIKLTGTTGFDNASLAEISAAMNDLVAAIKANTSLKREDLDSRQHIKWMRMTEIYMGIGKKEKAMALLSKIEEADAAGAVRSTSSMRANNSEIQSPATAAAVECDDKADKEAVGSPPDNDNASR